MARNLRWSDAAVRVLGQRQTPMHIKEIAAAIAEEGLRKTSSKTPAATLYGALRKDILTNPDTVFVQTARGTIALKTNWKAILKRKTSRFRLDQKWKEQWLGE